jgi:hypothetical protein
MARTTNEDLIKDNLNRYELILYAAMKVRERWFEDMMLNSQSNTPNKKTSKLVIEVLREISQK